MHPQNDAKSLEHKCFSQAVKYLSRREHSRFELCRKLTQAQACQALEAQQIETVLDQLVAKDWLNDGRFAEQFVSSRLERGQGVLKIRYALQQRGVDSEIFEAILAELEVDWIQQAEAARYRKFGAALPQDYKEKMRQSRFLATRGFDAETVQRVINGD